MEISNEIITKVRCQYIGQPFKMILNSGDFKTELLNIGMLTLLNNEDKLILKPISEITDEDAIECAILEGLVNAKVSQRGDGGIILKDDSYDLLLSFDCEVWLYKYGLKTHTDRSFLIYQYLISKGYDLPNYLLGGKKLQECGLAIYE
jgi:hypothetical protein